MIQCSRHSYREEAKKKHDRSINILTPPRGVCRKDTRPFDVHLPFSSIEKQTKQTNNNKQYIILSTTASMSAGECQTKNRKTYDEVWRYFIIHFVLLLFCLVFAFPSFHFFLTFRLLIVL
jgi:hypothetical protein